MIFKQIVGDLVVQAPKVLGFAPGGIGDYLSGMLENALKLQKRGTPGKTIPTAKQAAAVVAKARANPSAAVLPDVESPAETVDEAPTDVP